MTIVPKKKSDSRSASKAPTIVAPQDDGAHPAELQTQEHHRLSPGQCDSSTTGSNGAQLDNQHGDYSGYNSGDEHTHDRQPSFMQHWTEQEFLEKEAQFEKKINKKGWLIKKIAEDGACLFRAVADQIYGDQDMHSVLRKLCIDYIAKNSDYFSQYVTEDFGEYLKRKSLDHSHGNHIEIQAMSEMFNRPIEVYHYSSEPINIFQGQKSDNDEPIRLSYHRSVHYNSIVNPFKASVGVGLGLPAYEPGMADRNILEKAIRMSDEDAIEKAMLEDKLLATDWEATNEAIEEQVARESYLEWLRENENRMHKKFKKSSSPQPTTAAAACSNQQHNQSPSYYPPPTPSTINSVDDQQTACCSNSGTNTAATSASTTTIDTGNSSCSDKLNNTKDYGQPGTSTSSFSASSSSSCLQNEKKRYDSGNLESASSDANRTSPRASSSRDII